MSRTIIDPSATGPSESIDAPRRRRSRALSGACLLAVAACAGSYAAWSYTAVRTTGPQTNTALQAASRKPVTTTAAERHDVAVAVTGLGTVQALNTVTVKPRVAGTIQDLPFTEGQRVRPGTVLARIDPRPLAAALHQAQGLKEKDAAQLANARLDLARSTDLARKGYAAGQTLDTQKAAVASQEAAIDADEAAIEAAQVQLDYATVTAPIDGVTGIRMVDPGNVIQPTDPGIVVLTQIEPITVVFTLPADKVTPLPVGQPGRRLPVTVLAGDHTTKLASGQLALTDNRIDPATGMVRLKAVFDNADHALKPGQFVDARLQVEMLRDVVTLPPRSIQRDAQGAYVFTLDAGARAHRQLVQVGPTEGGRTVVTQGLQGGETVVLDGQYGLKDGAEVAVQPEGTSPEQVAALPGLP